jgi:hypothetical protein
VHWHLTTKHESLAKNHYNSFDTKVLEKRKLSILMRTILTKALLSSFKVSYLVASKQEPHTIIETLFLPAAMKMFEVMNGGKYGKTLKTVLVYNNRVMSRTESMPKDIKE